VGNARKVEPGRIVEVIIDADHPDVKQLSVHGEEPWNRVLCRNNGPARLRSVERIPGRR
jgi:hypothetical protein